MFGLEAREILIFAGPTRYELGESIRSSPGLCWQAPVRRGDLTRIVATRPPATIVLVDGLFYQALAVGHAEIRDALAYGWTVIGLGSMGAIRAYEMRDMGVRGFGRVYQQFLERNDLGDDEIAMLHTSEAPYRGLSEPLIHLRDAAGALARAGLVTQDAATAVVEQLASLWFGDRTLALFERLLSERAAPGARDQIAARIRRFDDHRIKARDLADCLHERPWEDPT